MHWKVATVFHSISSLLFSPNFSSCDSLHGSFVKIEINFANTLNNVVLEAIETYGALPLIAHQPKPEQKSPAPIISNIFTVITFVPILVFLVGVCFRYFCRRFIFLLHFLFSIY